MSPAAPRTFLISRTDAIGDVVLTLPVAGQLKQLFPDCRVVLIGRTYTAPVAAACPWVDDFVNLDELLKLPEPEQVAALRHHTAEAIIHVFPNKTLARLAQKARIPVRIGTRNRWQHWLTCNRLVALSRRHSPLHEAQLNLKLLQPLGYTETPPLTEVAKQVRLQATEPLATQWQQLLQQRQPGQLNVILHPRSRGSAREWGLDNYGRLAQLLHQAGHRVFVTGTAAEGEELTDWLRQNAAFLAANLTGQLSLPQFLAFIAAADGLVAGSTGPLHLAAALGRHALGPHAKYVVFDKPNCEDCRRQPATCTCIRAIEAATVAVQVAAWSPLLGE